MIHNIYAELLKDPLIQAKVSNRIRFYEYPESLEKVYPYIVIDPIATPRPVGFGDNKRIVYEYFYQIDVFTQSFNDVNEITVAMSNVLWEMGFEENGSGVDQYDSDLDVYRQAKRFIGQFENLGGMEYVK